MTTAFTGFHISNGHAQARSSRLISKPDSSRHPDAINDRRGFATCRRAGKAVRRSEVEQAWGREPRLHSRPAVANKLNAASCQTEAGTLPSKTHREDSRSNTHRLSRKSLRAFAREEGDAGRDVLETAGQRGRAPD